MEEEAGEEGSCVYFEWMWGSGLFRIKEINKQELMRAEQMCIESRTTILVLVLLLLPLPPPPPGNGYLINKYSKCDLPYFLQEETS